MPTEPKPVPTCPKCGKETTVRITEGNASTVECLYCLHAYTETEVVKEAFIDDPDFFTTPD